MDLIIGKARHDFCNRYVNMNHSSYLLFHYLRQRMASLEDCYFVSDGHGYKKRSCFLSKPWLNSILRISKLNSLVLLIRTSKCCRMCLMIFIWSETNWNGDTIFNLIFLNFAKLSQSTKLFNWKWFNLVFDLLILPTKWQNWLLLALLFTLYLPICTKVMKPCRTDIKYFSHSSKIHVHMQVIIIIIIIINHLFHFSTSILHGSSSKTKIYGS